MNKNFYYGICVAGLVLMYLLGILNADLKSIVLTGFAFVIVIGGIIMNELYILHKNIEAQEERITARLLQLNITLQTLHTASLLEKIGDKRSASDILSMAGTALGLFGQKEHASGKAEKAEASAQTAEKKSE